ncbi:MAG: hypothetical protein WBR13_07340 [Allosphingosinicella sp.]
MLASPILKIRSTPDFGSTFWDKPPSRVGGERAFSSFGSVAVANDNTESIERMLSDRFLAAQRELRSLAMHLPNELVVRILKQLRILLDPADWDEDDTPLSLVSFRSFVRAMAVLQPMHRPMLALSDAGNVIAMWAAGDARFTLEHLVADELRWYVRQNATGHLDVASGVTNIALLQGIVDAHNVRPLLDGQG